jgi:hypothetical protein
VPSVYWLAVVLISIVGTLITDNLSDNLGVSLVITTVGFSIVLAAVFAVWLARRNEAPARTVAPEELQPHLHLPHPHMHVPDVHLPNVVPPRPARDEG